MQESTSLLILWLLSSLKQERSTLCLIQMLECPAAQAEIALHRVTADGLAEQRDETWNLTQAGADHLREALPALLFRDTGSPLEELISACESKMPETACEICTKRMRVLRRRADTTSCGRPRWLNTQSNIKYKEYCVYRNMHAVFSL